MIIESINLNLPNILKDFGVTPHLLYFIFFRNNQPGLTRLLANSRYATSREEFYLVASKPVHLRRLSLDLKSPKLWSVAHRYALFSVTKVCVEHAGCSRL